MAFLIEILPKAGGLHCCNIELARTIANLEESEKILIEHIAEAINYRNLDREGWSG